MDPLKLSPSVALPFAVSRQPDDHMSGPLSERDGADRQAYNCLAHAFFPGEETVDPASLIQTGPADRPLAMPLQDLRPAWFQSLLEILGVARWRHPADRGIILGDA